MDKQRKQLIEFPMNDGSSVVFEVASDDPGTIRDQRIANNDDGEMTKSDKKFDAVVSRIRPAAQMVLDSLRAMNTPKEIELEFGVKFSGTTGVIIASANSEVNFKVRVLWENPAGQSGG